LISYLSIDDAQLSDVVRDFAALTTTTRED